MMVRLPYNNNINNTCNSNSNNNNNNDNNNNNINTMMCMQSRDLRPCVTARKLLSGLHLSDESSVQFRMWCLKITVLKPSPVSALGLRSPHLQFSRVNQLICSNPTSSNTTSLNSRTNRIAAQRRYGDRSVPATARDNDRACDSLERRYAKSVLKILKKARLEHTESTGRPGGAVYT